MEINILFDDYLEDYLAASWLQDIAGQILTKHGIDDDTEMGLVIASQQRVQELNRIYRGKDTTTDVLSFTMNSKSTEVPLAGFTAPPDGIRHLGEVIISYPQATKQAEEHRHSVKREVTILMIHGILHLLGYDHEEDELAQQMAAAESAMLSTIEGGL